jgi:hypothetical protein
LAKIYLHYVLDEWFESEVKPRLVGKAFLIRFADDFVVVFTHEADARRVVEVLPKRFGKFGLTLHPTKTRLVPFRSPTHHEVRTGRMPEPDTFDLLGFTHYWGQTRYGYWVVKRKTSSSRLRRAILATSLWCRKHRHWSLPEQHQALCQKLRGHYAYYGITGNGGAISSFREFVTRTWRKWLSRRKRGHPMPWDIFQRLLERYPLPQTKILHSI